MSVTIATSPTQSPTLLQRIFGTEPKTVVKETSVTTIVNDPGASIDWKTALRNGGIGAALGAALGGVSLLTKTALPFIGKIASVGALGHLVGTAGAIGAATAAIPFLVDVSRRSPTAKAAIIGGSIGAAAGAVLPFLPVWLGAAAGAGIGLVAHKVHEYNEQHPLPESPYPGYVASPGWAPYGAVPAGMTSVVPVGGQGYGYSAGYPSYGTVPYGYGATPYGYGAQMLPQTAATVTPGVMTAAPTVAPVAARAAVAPDAAKPAAAAKKAAKFPKAKTWVDKAGNVRQVGTGKVLKAAAGVGSGTSASVGSVPPATSAPGTVPSAAVGVLPQTATVLPNASAIGTTSSLPKLSTAGLAGFDLSSITNPTAAVKLPS